MEYQICSTKKYWMENSNKKKKKTVLLEWTKTYDKNVSYWIKIYSDLIKINFDIMAKMMA